jgi:serine/threonine protein kinase
MHTNRPDVSAILCQAVEIASPDERQRYLDQACGGDAELRRQVEELVRHHFEAGSFLEDPAGLLPTLSVPPPPEGPGTVIGPYKLLEQIGEGGMGVVYMAEQQKPVRRRVALKIIKPGMDSRAVIARFEAERQALALMDHPNIARILDAGVIGVETKESGDRRQESGKGSDPASLTPDPCPLTPGHGRPYFVMELVRGVPITEYCDKAKLNIAGRLHLFVTVCRAIQHAHQKGIIHRDIKPSNVLVTLHDGVPVPKVIDFGVAKATSQQLTERTLYTAFAEMIGTPLYMSPEQAEMSGLDIDTRTDVYSLGVLLYELLTGQTPFERDTLRKSGLDELRRLIREVEPPPPSSRLSTLNAAGLSTTAIQRSTEPRKLRPLLRGELDWIVMKALEKDRNRRYESASAFAADVERYLKNEAVQACPPSTAYRFRKFLRRNKGPVVAATLVLVALIGGVIGTSWQASRAIAASEQSKKNETRALGEEAKAKQSAAEMKTVFDFFVSHVFHAVLPVEDGGLGPTATLRAAIEAAEPVIDNAFRDQPLVEAAVRTAFAEVYCTLYDCEPAVRHFERALALREPRLAPNDFNLIKTKAGLAQAYWGVGRCYEKAVQLWQEIIASTTATLGADNQETLQAMAYLARHHFSAGKDEQALAVLEPMLEVVRTKYGPADPWTGSVIRMAVGYWISGTDAMRLKELQNCLEKLKAKLGPNHWATLETVKHLGIAQQRAGNLNEALSLLREAMDKLKAHSGSDSDHTLSAMIALAQACVEAGNREEAVSLLHEVREKRSRRLADQPLTGTAIRLTDALAHAYEEIGKHAFAEPLLREVLAARQRQGSADQPDVSSALARLGQNLLQQKKAGEAEKIVRECLVARKKAQPDGWTTFNAESMLGGSLLGQKKYAEAEPHLLQGYEGMKQREATILAAGKPRLTEALERLVQLYEETKRPDEAAKWREELEKRREGKKAESGELRVESQTRQEAKKQEAKKQDVKKEDAKKG